MTTNPEEFIEKKCRYLCQLVGVSQEAWMQWEPILRSVYEEAARRGLPASPQEAREDDRAALVRQFNEWTPTPDPAPVQSSRTPEEVIELLDLLARAADRNELSFSETAYIAREAATRLRTQQEEIERTERENSSLKDQRAYWVEKLSQANADLERLRGVLETVGNFLGSQSGAVVPQADYFKSVVDAALKERT